MENIASKTLEMIENEATLEAKKEEMKEVKKILGPPGAAKRAATSIAEFLKK